MDLRALAPIALSAALVACSDDLGGATENMTSGTGSSTGTTTTGTSSTAGTTAPDATTAAPTTGPGTTSTTGEPGTTTGEDTTTSTSTSTSTTGVSGCDGGGLGPGDHTLMLEHGGAMRSAIVHVPPGHDAQTASPLVLNFHGFTQNAASQVTFSLMNPIADANGFVVVYPDGLYNAWNAGECCGQAVNNDVDDIGFVRALVARLHEELCVDPRRIYATGMSNGGYISNRLACEAADLIAAIGPVSATIVIDPCTPSRAIPVMMFNGTNDFIVPYNGGLYQSIPQSFADWAAHDNCTDSPEVTQQVGGVTCETYDECDDDVAVTLCTVEGMGHCWPGNPVCPFGTPDVDIHASEAVWQFFTGFSLP